MDRICAACGFSGSEFRFEKAGYNIRQCALCGLEFVDFSPQQGFAQAFYSESFFKDEEDKFGYSDYVADKAMHMRYNAKKAAIVKHHISNGTLLDVGCAAGYFLESMGDGWDLHGVEPSECMVGLAREKFGDRVSHAPFEDYENSGGFDAVTMWDSLEHVTDPELCVRKAHSMLKDDGFLFVGTPDAGSVAARLLGRHWYYYSPPAHLHFFNKRNIRLFLTRTGFRVEKISYMGKYISVAEALINLFQMTGIEGFKRLSQKLANIPRWNIMLPYMVFDDMVIVARKT
jgi:2-polyprenyl-3-methyl-5-hydroxy-6-metoxy-1,4-benzoquinol methylase